jgi:hypothetical protein
MQYFPPVFSAVFSAVNFRRYFLQYFPPFISAGIFRRFSAEQAGI